MDKTEYAFPQPSATHSYPCSEGGLTLLDYFAAKALQGLLACENVSGGSVELTQLSYTYARDMMEARKK